MLFLYFYFNLTENNVKQDRVESGDNKIRVRVKKRAVTTKSGREQ